MPEVNPAPIALPRRLLAEAVGTGLLVTVVVGYGIAAQELSPGNAGLQLLENSTATVFDLDMVGEIVATAGLVALIFLLARTGRHALSAAAVGAAIELGLVVALFPNPTTVANPAITSRQSTAAAIQET